MTDREGFGPSYKGPLGDYTPEVGHNRPGISVSGGTRSYQGYHNIELLRNLLKQIKKETSEIIEKTENALSNYNLQTLTTTLQDVQKADWPEDLGDPKDYISFEQYKAYEHLDTRGARYMRKAYEDTVRGPAGTCALDVQIIASEIKTEAERIEGFLDDYLGSINDSAEYRILEAFQDWAYVALKYTRIFWGIFDSDNENAPAIPEEDVTKLSKDQAKSFQTLFKTKINAFNDEIVRTLDDIKRENAFQEQFYRDFLGPSVKFRLNFGNEISKSMVGGFFGAQADSAKKVFVDQIESAVADQLKRNTMFEKRFNELEVRIKARNAYAAYIAQLAPQGAPLRKPFISTQITQEEKDGFKALAETAIQAKQEKNTFRSSHGDLADISTEEAHPQYFPKTGGTVSGNIELDEEVTIDGVRPSTHSHLGTDGSEQIPGAGIQSATVQTNVVDRTEDVVVPTNLHVVLENQDEPGKANVDLKVAWDVDETAAGYQFEVQFVKYFTGADAACLVGHPNEYPSDPCDPSADGRIYLNTGNTLFFVPGETSSDTVGPVYPTDAASGYEMVSTFVMPLTDQVFIAGYDAPRTDSVFPYVDEDHVDFRLALCARSANDSLEYIKLNTLSVSDNAASYVHQVYSASARVNDTDILTGHINEYAPGASVSNKAPTIVLTRASVAVDYLSGSLAIVDFAKLLPLNTFEDFSGVNSICMMTSTTWVTSFPAVPVLGLSNVYIQVGGLSKTNPGDLTYDVIDCDETAYEVVSQGQNADPHSQVIRLTDSKAVILYGEDSNLLGIESGWYTRVITVSGDSFVSMGDPVRVADYTTATTKPKLSRLSSTEYVVVWGEANTAEACP